MRLHDHDSPAYACVYPQHVAGFARIYGHTGHSHLHVAPLVEVLGRMLVTRWSAASQSKPLSGHVDLSRVPEPIVAQLLVLLDLGA